jgi:outer membrane protein assembly factor BamB
MLAALVSLVSSVTAADRRAVPALPVRTHWSADLSAGVAVAPVNDGDRVFLSLRTAHVVALSLTDGREIWRISKNTTTAMDAAGGLLFLSAGEAIEAVRGTDGATAWVAPRLKATAPLVATETLLIVATEAELIALDTKDGHVAWRVAAGGIKLAPVADSGRVYAGADDGRVIAVSAASGAVVWEKYVEGGVTSLGAYRDRVYAGGGDKQFHCFDAARGSLRWSRRIGSKPDGAIAVDDDRVYFTALDNVVRGLDRNSGNQRWRAELGRRPIGGVHLVGHLLFLQGAGAELLMLYDQTGDRSGTIALPGDTARDAAPSVRETKAGLNVLVVTGSLSNQWHLSLVGPAGEAKVEPFASFALPGAPFLTDPEMVSLWRSLPWLVIGDPPLRPAREMGWPLVMQDPPLESFRVIPGLQLRPLSPVLPVRRVP